MKINANLMSKQIFSVTDILLTVTSTRYSHLNNKKTHRGQNQKIIYERNQNPDVSIYYYIPKCAK